MRRMDSSNHGNHSRTKKENATSISVLGLLDVAYPYEIPHHLNDPFM